MPKVIHIITGLNTGGAESMLYKLLAYSKGQGIEHEVIGLIGRGHTADRIQALGIKVECLNMNRRSISFNGEKKLIRAIRSSSPDILQGWMYHGNLASTWANIRTGIPCCWNIRHSLYRLRDEPMTTAGVILLNGLFSRWAKVIVNNSRVSAGHHARFGYPLKRTRVIPNGFDTTLFSPNPAVYAQMRKELGVDGHQLLFGLIGRVHPMKDHPNFLDAAGIIARDVPNARFLMVGRDVNMATPIIADGIRRNALEGKVVMRGETQDVVPYMAALDCYVSSSFTEGFPNVVGEAMSTALPCVVTDAGDSAWVVDNADLVAPVRNASRLAQAALKIANMAPQARKELGDKNRARVIANFSIKAIVDQYCTMYENIVAGRTV